MKPYYAWWHIQQKREVLIVGFLPRFVAPLGCSTVQWDSISMTMSSYLHKVKLWQYLVLVLSTRPKIYKLNLLEISRRCNFGSTSNSQSCQIRKQKSKMDQKTLNAFKRTASSIFVILLSYCFKIVNQFVFNLVFSRVQGRAKISPNYLLETLMALTF